MGSRRSRRPARTTGRNSVAMGASTAILGPPPAALVVVRSGRPLGDPATGGLGLTVQLLDDVTLGPVGDLATDQRDLDLHVTGHGVLGAAVAQVLEDDRAVGAHGRPLDVEHEGALSTAVDLWREADRVLDGVRRLQ